MKELKQILWLNKKQTFLVTDSSIVELEALSASSFTVVQSILLDMVNAIEKSSWKRDDLQKSEVTENKRNRGKYELL